MTFFEQYSSNTHGATSNQALFRLTQGEVRTGRVFYRMTVGGEYHYSLLFSNIMDSTFSLAEPSHKNLICDAWTIHAARVARCGAATFERDFFDAGVAREINAAVTEFVPLTIDGQAVKKVAPGEFFSSDPLPLTIAAGEYLCMEITFSGCRIPCHEETRLPTFVFGADGWAYDTHVPVAGMVGCDRAVKARVGFIGDSITQGIGAPINSYAHWSARLGEMLGNAYAYWNMGIGCGRANDMATDGAWAHKARQNDVLVICYGVNDILHGFPEEQTKRDLETIIRMFRPTTKTLILQTIPPFDYEGAHIQQWNRLNDYIRTELADQVDLVFDVVPCLRHSEQRSHMAKYGGHPDAEGSDIWAEQLYQSIKANGLL